MNSQDKKELEDFIEHHIPHGGQKINYDMLSPLSGPLWRMNVRDTPLHKPGVDESCLRCLFETQFHLKRTKSPVEQK